MGGCGAAAVEKLLITFLTEGWKRGENRAENTRGKALVREKLHFVIRCIIVATKDFKFN